MWRSHRTITLALTALVSAALLAPPAKARADTSGASIPPWAVTVAEDLLGPGPSTPSLYNPHPEVLSVEQLAARVYQNALSCPQLRKLKHGCLDAATGNILNSDGQPTGLNAASPPSPLNGCSGPNDPNATCHAYGGTYYSAYITANTCDTSPKGYDGCMAEPDQDPYVYYCGPGSSRVLASNWYGPPMYNLGESPPNSTSKGYAYFEGTVPGSGTYISNMATPINNDIYNHTTQYNPGYTSAGSSGTQNGFQNRVGLDITRVAVLIAEVMTNVPGGYPLPEWSRAANANHFVTIYSYDFTNYRGAINYFDSAHQSNVLPGRNGMYVYQFWSAAAAISPDAQLYMP